MMETTQARGQSRESKGAEEPGDGGEQQWWRTRTYHRNNGRVIGAMAARAAQVAMVVQASRGAMAVQAIREAMPDQEVQSAMAGQEVQGTMVDLEVQGAMADQEVQSAMADQEVQGHGYMAPPKKILGRSYGSLGWSGVWSRLAG
ncbi:hypothetical protein DPX16_12141 [Anabarilius grahami]|uniref:Uncharacterized protein n=1 Tax=Anabarilius grahami TaxID=495550 RepID=A0A3N0YQN7_ANAGA|nr:hypothetical protein DPX16_12141 [Anabarilius grahami]